MEKAQAGILKFPDSPSIKHKSLLFYFVRFVNIQLDSSFIGYFWISITILWNKKITLPVYLCALKHPKCVTTMNGLYFYYKNVLFNTGCLMFSLVQFFPDDAEKAVDVFISLMFSQNTGGQSLLPCLQNLT